MVRNYKRKTVRGPPDVIRKAIDHYCTTDDATKTTAALFGIQRTTLRDHLKKTEKIIPDPEKITAVARL